jgi:pyruvate/2-oxoglutarate dehydrogenase complex dihydrolipoamide dehydrogenase (E3) component
MINGTEYSAENIMVATGSKPFMPPIPGYDLPGVIDSTELIDMGGEEIPEFVIIGGGVIGIEFATIYADLGDHVTVIEGLDRLLPVIDKEIGRSIKMTLEKKGVDVHVSSPVSRIEQEGDKLAVFLTNKKGEEIRIAAEVPGTMFILSSDAHVPEAVGVCDAGIRRALSAGLDPERIVNIRRVPEEEAKEEA